MKDHCYFHMTSLENTGFSMVTNALSILKLKDGSDKNMFEVNALTGKKFQFVWYDSNQAPLPFMLWVMEPDLNVKYKIVISQVKKGTKYFYVTKVFKYDSSQLIKLTHLEDENLNAVETTNVKVFASLGPAFFSADDGILSNLKVVTDPECVFEDQSIETF